jgi:glycosyltransferase involved in cell wall biosynthesis
MMASASFLDQVTPVLLTFNEERNIGRALTELRWAQEVVVVDSGSTDNTLDILRQYGNVRCVHRTFDSHAKQWQFAVTQTGIKTGWVLAMDADYVLTPAIVEEIARLTPAPDVQGYRTHFRYCIAGKPLTGTLYPPVITLYRRSVCDYEQDGHTQRLRINHKVVDLRGLILHDDRKPLARWLASQDRYAALEAAFISSKPWKELRIQDRLRRMVLVTPWLVPLYCLTAKRGYQDGWSGLYYALQRGVAETILSLKLIELRLSRYYLEN